MEGVEGWGYVYAGDVKGFRDIEWNCTKTYGRVHRRTVAFCFLYFSSLNAISCFGSISHSLQT